MKSHEVDFEILGQTMQVVEVELDPGETVIAEAGAMNYMDPQIEFEAKLGDGSQADQGLLSKMLSAGKRLVTGESLFLTHFTNKGSGKQRVGFSAPFPGRIIPLNLGGLGKSVICQKDSFLAAALGTKVTIAFNQRLGSGFFGGEGFILQRLEGDGMAFIHAGGHIVQKVLKGDSILVDTGCVVAYEETVSFEIQRAGGLKSMFFGGEGLFLAKLSGSGKIWIQSLPFSRLADRVIAHAPRLNGQNRGETRGFAGFGD